MGMVEMAQKIKETHPKELIIYKSGSFYKSFGKDSYILSSMFGYKLKIVNQNVSTCGFPLNTIIKVRHRLEENKISYILIDQRNNYDVELNEDFGNLNKYDEEFNKAYTRVKHKKRIDSICQDLVLIMDKPYFKEVVRKMEDVLDENREV